MGSICYINKNPRTWTAFETDKQLKPEFGGERLMKVRYGIFDDYPDGVCDMEMYMRTSIYQALMNGTYTISHESAVKHRLILLDNNGNIVPSLSETCY